MDFKDYYATLGVARTASDKEIKAAYRRLARKHHPDVNKGQAQSEARFKEVGEAYEVLSDPQKRRQYDELSAGGIPFTQARSRSSAGPASAGDFSEFFRTFFGSGGGFGDVAGQPLGGLDGLSSRFGGPEQPELMVELTLREVLHGATRDLSVHGRRMEVRIPPGVREGARVRVAGGAGRGWRGGADVFLRVAIARDPQFERRDDDLATTVEVPLPTAVLGGEARVATLEGELAIRIPELTPAGRTFRLRGHGLPRAGGGRGDLLASLTLKLPLALDPRLREVFEELRRSGL